MRDIDGGVLAVSGASMVLDDACSADGVVGSAVVSTREKWGDEMKMVEEARDVDFGVEISGT